MILVGTSRDLSVRDLSVRDLSLRDPKKKLPPKFPRAADKHYQSVITIGVGLPSPNAR